MASEAPLLCNFSLPHQLYKLSKFQKIDCN